MAAASEIFALVGRIALDGLETVTDGLNNIQERANATRERMQRFGEATQNAGAKAKETGEGLTKWVTAPLSIIGGLAIASANDLEVANGRIMAGLGIGEQAAKEYTDAARELWSEGFGDNIVHAADNIAMVGQQLKDLSVAELQQVTKEAMVLEKRFGVDIAESTATASAMVKTFGIDASHSMDLMTKGFQLGGDYSGELMDTLREYGPQFQAMGISADEMLNILIKGADAGAWNLDKVGDAVKEFNIRAQDGSKTTAEGFAAIGLNADEMGQAIAQGGETAQNSFAATISGLAAMDDPVQQNIAGVKLFGTQWEDVRKEVILAMGDTRDVLGEVEGATKRAGDSLNDNFTQRLKTTWRGVQDALIPAGTILLDLADSVLPKVEKAVNWLSDGFEKLGPHGQQMAVIGGLIAAGLGPLLVILGTMISAVGTIITLFAGFTAPVMGAVAGIGLLVAALVTAYASSEKFREIVARVFGAIGGYIQKGMMAAWGFIQSIWNQIQAFWDQNGQMIIQAVENVFNFLAPIISFAMGIVAATVRTYWNIVTTIFQGAVDLILGIIQFFAALFTGNWSALWDSLKGILSGALQIIWGIIQLVFLQTIMGVFKLFGTKLLGFLRGLWTQAVGVFRSMGQGIMGVVNSIRTTVTNSISGMVQGVINFLRNLSVDAALRFMQILTAGRNAFNNLKTAITTPITAAKETVRKAIDSIKGFFSNLKLKLPKIQLPPMPKFEMTGKFSLNPPQVPKFNVDWFAKGGVFDGASIIGVGEQPGVKEAVIPLSGRNMLPFANAIASAMPGGGGGDNFYITISAADIREFNNLIEIIQGFRQSVRRGGGGFGTNEVL